MMHATSTGHVDKDDHTTHVNNHVDSGNDEDKDASHDDAQPC